MGGRGSGNWYLRDSKATVEDCRTIDVREWYRKGLLRPGGWVTARWFRDDQEVARLGARLSGDERVSTMVLLYTAGRGDDAEEIKEVVLLVSTPCHFGGERPWFVCPGVRAGVACGRRASKLYCLGQYFACRRCLDLRYTSQRERAGSRILRRSQAIRLRLGGSASMIEPFPAKPRGMHWWTYDRLREQAYAAEATHDTWLETWLRGMDRFLERRGR